MDSGRKIYLEDKPRKEALEECLRHFEPNRRTETIPVTEALGRVTAKAVYAKKSMPHYHASAMDGIAVVAEKTSDAHESNPLQLREGEDFVYVDTGNAIPSPFNAVIMIEDINEVDEHTVEIIEPATPWQRIRPIGEDITFGEMLFPEGHRLRPVDLGVLLASGMTTVEVVEKPIVHIIPSGNEIVHALDATEKPGEIIEFNGTIFAGLIEEWGGNPQIQPIVPDDPEKIKNSLLKSAEEADIIVINAGSSAGSRDYTVRVLEQIGEVYTHGIGTRPGKPVSIGKVKNTIVVGVPGYPVSAFLVMDWFVKPLISKYLHVPEPMREKIEVVAGRRIVSSMGSEDFIRVNIGKVNGKFIANPLTRSASVTMSLTKADGIIVIPENQLGIEQGETIEAELLKPRDEIEAAVLFSGSHDLCIDILSNYMKKNNPLSKITASHTGSMAGITAIKRGEAHVAGIHLLDPETGEYNVPYVKRFFKDDEVVIVPFLKRMQGWIVPKGNPHGIKSVEDLTKKNIHYVNRQRGAGTRILLDYLLSKNNINPEEIEGYEREMYTHLSVAAEVKINNNNVGMGIYSAALAMDLDFVPVAEESYDLLMSKEFFESEKGKHLLETIQNPQFKEEVHALGGYKVCDDIEPIWVNKN